MRNPSLPTLAAAALVLPLVGTAIAADKPKPAAPAAAAPAAAAEPQTFLTTRGKPLLAEGFADAAALKDKKRWNVYKGDFSVVDGGLRSVEKKEDGHHPAMSTKLPAKDLVMQCRFKVGQSKFLGLSLDNGKEKVHVFRAMVTPTSFSIRRMSGMGPTTKGETIAERKFKFEPDKWYTMVVEIRGKEVVGTVPEAGIALTGEHDGVAIDKDRLELISGGDAAWFDDVKAFEAEANADWARNKARIEAMNPKPAGKK